MVNENGALVGSVHRRRRNTRPGADRPTMRPPPEPDPLARRRTARPPSRPERLVDPHDHGRGRHDHHRRRRRPDLEQFDHVEQLHHSSSSTTEQLDHLDHRRRHRRRRRWSRRRPPRPRNGTVDGSRPPAAKRGDSSSRDHRGSPAADRRSGRRREIVAVDRSRSTTLDELIAKVGRVLRRHHRRHAVDDRRPTGIATSGRQRRARARTPLRRPARRVDCVPCPHAADDHERSRRSQRRPPTPSAERQLLAALRRHHRPPLRLGALDVGLLVGDGRLPALRPSAGRWRRATASGCSCAGPAGSGRAGSASAGEPTHLGRADRAA